jgi:hypothetical protein
MLKCFHVTRTHLAHAPLHRSPIPMSSGSSPFLSVDVFLVHGDRINTKVVRRQARQLYRFKTQARTKDDETRRGKHNEQRPRIFAFSPGAPIDARRLDRGRSIFRVGA